MLLTACGTGEAGEDAGGAGSGAYASEVLDFTGKTLDGDTLDASTLSEGPTVFWFWAPWCSVCRAEAPGVARVAAKFDGRVKFVGVPGLGEPDDMRKFVGATKIGGFAHVVDLDGSVWKRFGVTAQPAYAFVDDTGKVSTVPGGLDESDLEQSTADLISK